MRRHKKYITDSARRYVDATKRHLSALLVDRDVSPAELARATGIPESTISRWLSLSRAELMGIDQAAVIAQALGVSVHELLIPEELERIDPSRYHEISALLAAPIDHVIAISSMYKAIITAD